MIRIVGLLENPVRPASRRAVLGVAGQQLDTEDAVNPLADRIAHDDDAMLGGGDGGNLGPENDPATHGPAVGVSPGVLDGDGLEADRQRHDGLLA
ncbi:hypothetical protein [Streptomyces katrae]|uniref:hypothetical protein n=1 Tax=Streptomyces katrae TaxID=68223 RepID=UPI001F1C1E24|nr:hypothetical protein [Streptomyces katrae]